MLDTNSFLEREKISSLMIRYSVPLIVSLLVAALYNIVDQIFIANASYLGSNGNAANNVVFPMTVIAVIGIVMKFFQIVISVVVGLSASCTPIAGYNVGAGRPDRVKSLFTMLLKCEAVLGLIAFVIVEVFPADIAALFGASGESVYYAEFTVKCFRTYLCLIVLACINKAAFIFIQAMGRPYISAGLSIIREVIFGAGLTIIMPMFMGLDGVLWSMPASDALTFVISVCVIVMIYRELSAKPEN